MMDALSREPYRILFPLSMALGAGLISAWGVQLHHGGALLTPASHGTLMVYGAFGTAILGFLLTAFPKQNDAAQPPTVAVIGLGLAQLAMVLAGLWGRAALAGGIGALAWAGVAAWASAIALPSLKRKWDPTTAAIPPALGLASLGLALWASGQAPLLVPALAVHGVLVPVALVLLNRILPFFSQKRPGYDGIRRPWFTGSLLVLGVTRALAEAHAAALSPLASLALLLLIGRQWQGWRPLQGLRPPLLGVLHLGIAWILVAYLVDAVGVLLGFPPSAARHLWTLGGLGTLLFGISIRVTRGHGGQPLVLGVDGAVLVGLVQLAVLLRGVLPLLGVTATWLWPAAALLLGLAMLGWLLRFGPLVLRA